MQYAIRRAVKEDHEAVCRVLAGADRLHLEHLPHLFRAVDGPVRSREHVEGLVDNPEALLLVAEAGGEAVGCAIAYLRSTPATPIIVPRRTAMVDTLAVLEGWRRRGVGRALMEAVHSWARESGADDLELNVYEFNREAIAFYRALGYETEYRRMRRQVTSRNA